MFIVQDWFSIVPDIIMMCLVTVWSQICYLGKKKIVSDIKKNFRKGTMSLLAIADVLVFLQQQLLL